jgi:Histidine kinase-, DNA gyrase B-, and HSP90-like ATPase
VLGKIFSPFLTTRSEGSGLGLALCKKYIEVLGGKIEVRQLGIGTTFVITLPKISHQQPGLRFAWVRRKPVRARDGEDSTADATRLGLRH